MPTFPTSAERWLRGRKHRTRNAAWAQAHRGFESHPLRHRALNIERMFGCLKINRAIATRYELRTMHFAGFIFLAAFMIGMR